MNTRSRFSNRILVQHIGALILAVMAVGMTPAIADAAGLKYAYGAEAVSLDVADAIDGPSFDVVYNIHEGLVDQSSDGEIIPELAVSWTLSDDRLNWIFKLRSDVVFPSTFDAVNNTRW